VTSSWHSSGAQLTRPTNGIGYRGCSEASPQHQRAHVSQTTDLAPQSIAKVARAGKGQWSCPETVQACVVGPRRLDQHIGGNRVELSRANVGRAKSEHAQSRCASCARVHRRREDWTGLDAGPTVDLERRQI
jgi:hypothetical protein